METNQNQVASPNPQPNDFLKQMEQFFKTYLYDKAPFHFPPNVKEFLVKFGPWVLLIVILLSIPVLLLALGIGAFTMPFAVITGAGRGMFFFINIAITITSLILEGLALPGLFARKIQGWRFAYYASLLSTLGQLLSGEIIGAIIGLIISMYVLFQIKEYYK